MRNTVKNIAGKQTARRTWGLYLLTLIAWAGGVAALAYLGIVFSASITWQPGILYSLLQWVKEYLLLVLIISVLTGWIVISYFFIARPVERSELLLSAAEQLAQPSHTPIRFPSALKSAEDKLNLVREQALRNLQAAKDAEQRKNDLVVYLAHDLKTPLTSIIGYLTLLRDEPDLSPAFRARYTGIALSSAERLEDLINEFFDITRFSLTHLELERETIDLKRMLEQMASEFEPVLQEKEMQCTLSLPATLTAVCDPEKMARVFENLLNNAFHYGFARSVIAIKGTQDSSGVTLTFRNAGPTIPPEKLQRMFEQFFRLDTSRGTKTGNAGLGLAIAREIVEAHGGTITAASYDEQIIFTIFLPSAAAS